MSRLGAALGAVIAAHTVAFVHAQPQDALVVALAQSTLVGEDKNGDGVITGIDALAAIKADLLAYPACDMDGDGALTGEDTIAAIEQIILRSFGDVTGDRKVDVADSLNVLSSLGVETTNLGVADVNLDGVVDAEDLTIVMAQLGSNTPLMFANQLAQRAYYKLGSMVGDHEGLSEDPGGGGGDAPWPLAGGHTIAVTRSYPSEHGLVSSWSFPSNHMYTVTQSWPALPPGAWPSNHVRAASSTWEEPESHSQSFSEQWEHAPGHWASVSGSWGSPPVPGSPPGPGTHDGMESRLFSPGHIGSLSTQRQPTPHHAFVSDGWHDTGTSSNSHGTSFSGMWPTNHQGNLSATWHGSHHGNTSTAWPSNHQQAASESWPNGTYPSWAPNHFASTSNQDSQPPPGPWPLFPADHSWWTSVNDLRH